MDQQLMSILSLMYPQVGAVLPVLSKLTGNGNQNNNQNLSAQQAAPALSDGKIIYVQGESEASAYRVPAGAKIALFDSEADIVYIKYADADGKQHMATADLTFRVPENPDDKFVKKADFEKFQQDLFAALGKINSANQDNQNNQNLIPAN